MQNNNCKKSIVNNLYFCTKINIKKRKKKSKKNLKTEREKENNNIKNFYMNRLSFIALIYKKLNKKNIIQTKFKIIQLMISKIKIILN